MTAKTRGALAEAVRVATDQDGVISRRQALACGLSSRVVERQLAAGRWQHVFKDQQTRRGPGRRPGVYAIFSGPIGRKARRWAAVLACGEGATLSHEAAAEIFGLVDPAGQTLEPIDVTVPAGRRVTPPPGVRRHYSNRVQGARHPAKRPPCTRLEETVIDLTQSAKSLDAASEWIAKAVRERLTTHDRIIELIRSRPRLKWRRELLESCGHIAAGAHSLLEIRYLRKVERPHGLPRAERQVRHKADGHGIVIDIRYRRYHTRIELDGQRGHTGDGVFRDSRRDNAAVLAGEWTLRFGWDAADRQPCQTAAIVYKVLRDRGYQGTIRPCSPTCPINETFQHMPAA